MCAIWSAGRENSSALLSGLSVVENDVILLAWSPAPPHPASASAMARQPAEKLPSFVGRAFRHDVRSVPPPGVLTPGGPTRHVCASRKAKSHAAYRPVLLVLKFIAPRVELSDLRGGPGFSPAKMKFLSLGFSC